MSAPVTRPAPVLLRGAALASGESADVLVADGLVAAVGPDTSAHPAASAGAITRKPAASAFCALPPGRSPMATSFTPESRRFIAWAWPWLPNPITATLRLLIKFTSASRS